MAEGSLPEGQNPAQGAPLGPLLGCLGHDQLGVGRVVHQLTVADSETPTATTDRFDESLTSAVYGPHLDVFADGMAYAATQLPPGFWVSQEVRSGPAAQQRAVQQPVTPRGPLSGFWNICPKITREVSLPALGSALLPGEPRRLTKWRDLGMECSAGIAAATSSPRLAPALRLRRKWRSRCGPDYLICGHAPASAGSVARLAVECLNTTVPKRPGQ